MMSCVEKSWPWSSVLVLFLILFYFLESLTQTSCWSVKVAFHRTNFFFIVCWTKPQKIIFRNNLNIFRIRYIFADFELFFLLPDYCETNPILLFFMLNEFGSLAGCIQKCMWDNFQKLPYHFLQNQMKGRRAENFEIFIAY